MGLHAYAKNLEWDKHYDGGYVEFCFFRTQLAFVINEEYGKYYKKWYHSVFEGELSKQEKKNWTKIANTIPNIEDVEIFLLCSDTYGKLNYKECKKILNFLEKNNIKLDMRYTNYGRQRIGVNMLEHWKNIFRHCYKKRVNLYFR